MGVASLEAIRETKKEHQDEKGKIDNIYTLNTYIYAHVHTYNVDWIHLPWMAPLTGCMLSPFSKQLYMYRRPPTGAQHGFQYAYRTLLVFSSVIPF